ncbi:MAG TPA: SBBP repeat-containing protein, partial [Nitrospirota bacterium]
MKKLFPYLTLVAVLLLAGFLVRPLLSKKNTASAPTREETLAKLQHLSIPFVANQGQTNKEVKFYAHTFGGTVFVTKTGEIVYSLPEVEGDRVVNGAAIREKPANAKPQFVTGEERSTAIVNDFRGNDRTKWQRGLPAYDVLSLGEIYKGVDLKLKAYGNNVEKLFYVRPQADPSAIAMNVEGAKQLNVNKQGELLVNTGQGMVKFTRPVAYQEINGKRTDVAVSYAVSSAKPETQNTRLAYSFNVGAYDKTRELVIDPLLASTYLGGTDREGSLIASPVFAMSIVIGHNGNIYVAGWTDSTDFPTTTGAYLKNSPLGLPNAFVACFNPNLTGANFIATYLGGSGADQATALVTDNVDNVYVAGFTNSTNFPVSAAPAQTTNHGGYDAFVSKLTST